MWTPTLTLKTFALHLGIIQKQVPRTDCMKWVILMIELHFYVIISIEFHKNYSESFICIPNTLLKSVIYYKNRTIKTIQIKLNKFSTLIFFSESLCLNL